MRIYRERVPEVSKAVVDALVAEELIEVDPEMRDEVELDVASVLHMYRRTDYELTEKARDLVALRQLDYSHTHKLKSKLAQEQRFGIGEEAIDWIVDQMLEILMQSRNVEEIYGEDHDIRRLIAPVLRKELGVDTELDEEVRRRIKNLEEGTTDYEIEYKKTMEKVRRAKGLSE